MKNSKRSNVWLYVRTWVLKYTVWHLQMQITHWHCSTSCFKEDSVSQCSSVEIVEIWRPLSSKPQNQWPPNLAWVMRSGRPWPLCKILSRSQYDDLQYAGQRQTSMRSASTAILEVPRSQTAIGDRSFSIAGSWVWNTLPVSVHDINSSLRFRKLLKAFFFVWRPQRRRRWTGAFKYTYLLTY